jgi:hypothetical protein
MTNITTHAYGKDDDDNNQRNQHAASIGVHGMLGLFFDWSCLVQKIGRRRPVGPLPERR